LVRKHLSVGVGALGPTVRTCVASWQQARMRSEILSAWLLVTHTFSSLRSWSVQVENPYCHWQFLVGQ
jgi:hypothetical protein